MKYIKGFNEELKSNTYRSAAWKIKELSRNKSDTRSLFPFYF